LARKPNYQFERMERDRAKAAKLAAKAALKQQQRENAQGERGPETQSETDGDRD